MRVTGFALPRIGFRLRRSTTAATFPSSLGLNPHVEEGEYVKEVAAGADIGRAVGKVVGVLEDGSVRVDLVTRCTALRCLRMCRGLDLPSIVA